MAWSVEFNETAKRSLRKLDRQWQSKILDYLEDQIAVLANPRSRGKALLGDKQGLWRYRVSDYRIICNIEADSLVILVIELGHRRGFTTIRAFKLEGATCTLRQANV